MIRVEGVMSGLARLDRTAVNPPSQVNTHRVLLRHDHPIPAGVNIMLRSIT
jgi:hypothetical protein